MNSDSYNVFYKQDKKKNRIKNEISSEEILSLLIYVKNMKNNNKKSILFGKNQN